jgi:hypothetical protein
MRLLEIDTVYRTVSAHARLMSKQLLPGFPTELFPEKNRLEARREWDRASNQYAYADKIKDYSRLHQVIACLKNLYERHPTVGQLAYNIGCCLNLMDKPADALPYFESAAEASRIAEAMYNAADASLRAPNKTPVQLRRSCIE